MTKTVVRFGVAACAAVLALSGCGSRPPGAGPSASAAVSASRSADAAPARAARYAPYVALGDSYAAGPRIPTQHGDPPGCLRSTRNYPSLVAAGLGLTGADFRDVSCSGATASGMASDQRTDDGTAPPQLDALSAGTRLVTVGIGGNDTGYFSVLVTCARLDMAAREQGRSTGAPCAAHYGAGGLDGRIAHARSDVAALLARIVRRSPHATVLVVGYPAVFPARSAGGCSDLLLTAGDVAFLRAAEQRLNAALAQDARAAGARYVDTYGGSVGHDACEDAGRRWIEPLLPSRPAMPLHPNASGEAALARAVLAALGR